MRVERNKLKMTRKGYIYFIVMFLLIIIISILFMRSKKDGNIIIGFSAQLTGSQAELGVQERNGVQLAIEKINESGGISGRKISLIINDDLGVPEQALSGDNELIKKGAIAIIGHATTSQTLAGLKVTNPAEIIMIGATVSTPELSGLDDYFFRVHPSFKNRAQSFAKYIYEHSNIKRMTIIYDEDNSAYAKNYSTIFTDEFKELGGEITDEVSFSSAKQPNFSPLLEKLHASKAEGLLIVASDIDTALIAQRERIMDNKILMFTSVWAQTETLISNGGKAVEGMKIEQAYDSTRQSEPFIDFKSRYKARFGNEASFGAAYSYEATLVLAEALKKTNGNKEGLKQALLQTHNFNGLMDTFSLDKFGDVDRSWYVSSINKGKFTMVDRLTSTNSGGE